MAKNRKFTRFLSRISRGTKVFAVSMLAAIMIVCTVVTVVKHALFSPVDKKSTEPITLEIELGSSASAIANKLEENGVIRSATVFKLFVDIYDRRSQLKAGTYEFMASMTMNEVLDVVCSGSNTSNVVKVFLPEGGSVETLAKSLVNLGLIDKEQTFIDAMKDPTPYQAYAFLEEAVKTKDNRIVAMEGYLFPDTYLVYKNASIEQIVSKFLVRFNQIYSDDYAKRAAKLGLSLDQVITMASIVQKEAKTDDFKKVAAVFHNRLKEKMTLGSDVTVQYVLNNNKMNLTNEDIAVDSPYNTYRYKGLPPGPICNPGKEAIEAVLWPDEQYIEDNVLYFCLTDPETGVLVFAKTLEEHQRNVDKYRPLWIEYDKKH
ncbi:MAG: endolytic transglycosylase MltG [Clostridia bacterium]|nr:endolytic transglycosylase MltG [Clostridia bacterium]